MNRITNKIPSPLLPILRLLWRKVKKARNFFEHTRTKDQLHSYWSSPPDFRNYPEAYLIGKGNSKLLLRRVEDQVGHKDKILEVGSNIGRNLAYLFEAGFKNLESIEINRAAVKMFEEHFPQVAASTTVHLGAMETIFPKIPDNSAGLVYSMAVMEHVHPESENVFSEMARITSKVLITIENEKDSSWKAFARNYKLIFEKLGFLQVYEEKCGENTELSSSYMARIFHKIT